MVVIVQLCAHVSITVDQGSAHEASGPNLAHLAPTNGFLEIRHVIYMHIICGCFGAKRLTQSVVMVGPSTETIWSTKPEMLMVWSFTEKVC